MRKHIFFIFCLFIISNYSFGQMTNPVKWAIKTEKLSTTDFYVSMTASIDSNWIIYSPYCPVVYGYPGILTITFFEFNNVWFSSSVIEEIYTPKEVFDSIPMLNTKYFENNAEFKQKMKLKMGKKARVCLKIYYIIYNHKLDIATSQEVFYKITVDKKGNIKVN